MLLFKTFGARAELVEVVLESAAACGEDDSLDEHAFSKSSWTRTKNWPSFQEPSLRRRRRHRTRRRGGVTI